MWKLLGAFIQALVGGAISLTEKSKRRFASSSNLSTMYCSVQRRLPPQPHRDPVVLARGPLLQQRDALAAAAVRDGDEQGAHERLQGAVRLQRAPALHHREVGQPHQLSPGAHLLQQVSTRAANEPSRCIGENFTIMERASTGAFSWLKAPITFKTL